MVLPRMSGLLLVFFFLFRYLYLPSILTVCCYLFQCFCFQIFVYFMKNLPTYFIPLIDLFRKSRIKVPTKYGGIVVSTSKLSTFSPRIHSFVSLIIITYLSICLT